MIQKILEEVYQMELLMNKDTAHKVHWWRSSSLGSCKRGQFLGRMLSGDFKVQHDRRTMDVFQIGNIVEDIKMEKLKKHPNYLIIEQGEMFSTRHNLSGHFDAIVIELATSKPHMFECKSKNSMAFTWMDRKKQGAMHHHKLQINSYMWMVNDSGFALADDDNSPESPAYQWLIKNAQVIGSKPYAPTHKMFNVATKPIWKLKQTIEEGFILYVSKDDQRLLEFPVAHDDTSLLNEWQGECEELNSAWNNHLVLPATDPKAWQGKYCQFCQAGLCEKLSSKEVVDALFDTVAQEEAKAQLSKTTVDISGFNPDDLSMSLKG